MEAPITDGSLRGSPTIELNTNLGPDATYHAGDEIAITVTASVDAFVGLFSIDSRGSLRQLYPATGGPQTRAGAKQRMRVVDFVGKRNGVFGVETLIGIASLNPIPLENQPRRESFVELLRTWASSSAAPKHEEGLEIAVIRFLTAP
jgi:hypothetical protein